MDHRAKVVVEAFEALNAVKEGNDGTRGQLGRIPGSHLDNELQVLTDILVEKVLQ